GRRAPEAGGEAGGGERRGGRRRGGGQHQPDADPADQHPGEVPAPVVRLVAEPAQEPEAGEGKEDPAERAGARAAVALCEPAGKAGDDRGGERAGEEGEAGPGGRVVPDGGQEEDGAQQEDGERGEEEQGGERGEGERQGPEQRQLDDRRWVPCRSEGEECERDGGGGEEAE